MGFQPAPRVLDLSWDSSSAWAGLEVSVTSMTMSEYLEALAGSSELTEDDEGLWSNRQQRILAQHLTGWNLEWSKGHPQEGEPVPLTLAGLVQQDTAMVRDIISEWIEQTASVPAPLGGRSTSGETFRAQSLPMDPP